jgi:hypothetical protein
LALVEEVRRRTRETDDFWESYDPIYYVRGEPTEVDWKHPDYPAIEEERQGRLERLRSDSRLLPYLRYHYRDHPVDFIADWGVTFDPRNPEVGLPARIPFVPFPRQVDWCEYALRKWRSRERALSEKSRDCGVTWLAVSLSATLCLFHEGVVCGFGSRLEEYVDKIGDPKSIFEKARIFMRALPQEFRGTWSESRNSFHMRLMFPDTGSLMVGEGGDNIGRGNRTSLYFVDEAAHLERPLVAEASLIDTTNCRHDVSSVHGLGNPFEQNRHSGKIEVFVFDWHDDPRKSDAWYQKKLAEAHSPAIVAQEIDRDYAASVEGVLIPASWVGAALDAHLRFAPGACASGSARGGLDVADEGVDRNAFVAVKGVLMEHVEEWSGLGGDIYATVQRALALCSEWELGDLRYDADGLGAGVRGDARAIQEQETSRRRVGVLPFRGSAAVLGPERQDVAGRKNKDMFLNRKAQAWWSLRNRFLATYRHVAEGIAASPGDVVSISSSIPASMRSQLASELSQPTWDRNGAGKIFVDKTPAGNRSPNLADAVMIAFADPEPGALILPPAALRRVIQGGRAAPLAAPSRNRFARAR